MALSFGLEFKEFTAKTEIIWTKTIDEGVLLGMKFISMGRQDRRALARLFEFMNEHA